MTGVLGKLTNASSYDDVAQALITECYRRGYMRVEAIGVVADGIQESGLRMVWSGNRLWYGYFQQDTSYPNRTDPNGNIRGFLDRLDVKRTSPDHGDIWENIFWLQQGPNWPSAHYAVTHGRVAYLTEIKSRAADAARLDNLYGPTDTPAPTAAPTLSLSVRPSPAVPPQARWRPLPSPSTAASTSGENCSCTVSLRS